MGSRVDDAILGEDTIVAEAFDLEEAAVGRKSDGGQRRQIAQALADTEVVSVVDGGLGSRSGSAHLRMPLSSAWKAMPSFASWRLTVTSSATSTRRPWGEEPGSSYSRRRHTSMVARRP